MKEHKNENSRFPQPRGAPVIAASVVTESAFAAGTPPAVSPTDRAPLLYVVDDDEAVRDSLRWLLESAGYRVVTYSTAERFLLEYEPGAAACLTLDVRLPGMSGLDLQEELNRRGNPLPIIFIAEADEQTALEALKNGASHFLRKPFQDAQLLDLIGQAARHSYGAGTQKCSSHS